MGERSRIYSERSDEDIRGGETKSGRARERRGGEREGEERGDQWLVPWGQEPSDMETRDQ